MSYDAPRPFFRAPAPRRLRTARRRLAAACAIMLAGLSTAALPAPGDLDPAFGDNGVLFIDVIGGNDEVRALLPLEDGGVLAAGTLDNGVPSGGDLAVVRLDRAGNLDAGFGAGGAALADTGTDGDGANALLRQPDGRIVAAGHLESGAYLDFGIARFLADGSPDTGFGESDGAGGRLGYARVNLGPDTAVNDEARAVARQADGKLVLAGVGFAQDGSFKYQRFGLVRFTTDGQVDTDFGADGTGIVISPATAFQVAEYVTGIARRTDGSLPANDSLTVVGYVFARAQALVRRYHADGTPDAGFDGDGTLVIDDATSPAGPTGMSHIRAVLIQPDGKLLVAGTGRDRAFVIMRFHANGSRDTGFGSNGRVAVKFSASTDYDEAFALALQPNGKIVAAGFATGRYEGSNGEDFAVARLLPDGTPDPGFGDGQGRSTYPLATAADRAEAVAVLSDGRLLAAGYAQRPGTSNVQADMAFLGLQGDPDIFSDGFESD